MLLLRVIAAASCFPYFRLVRFLNAHTLLIYLIKLTNPPEPSPAKTRESSGSVSGSLPLLLLLALRLPLVACRFAAAADVASAVSLRWRLLLPLRPLLLLLISAQ
jgi:hypothetical protein